MIELDNDQHKSYNQDDEVIRLMEIKDDFEDKKPLVVIRLNLDTYKDNTGLRIEGC